jgi:sulfatase modifying factor 1
MTKCIRQLWLLGFLLIIPIASCRMTPSPSDSTQPNRRSAESANANPDKPPEGMVLIKGGTFLMGTNDGMPYEAPVHEVTINSFWMDEHEVTVAEFSRFVNATGYQTDAEELGWSGVFNLKTGEWERVNKADWRHPDGPGSPDQNEPVCQVSWSDATAYASWAGKRLPTEAEWEYAARGGLVGKRYAWGDELRPGGKPVANWWQGHFPEQNTGEDGFIQRARVKSFSPNGYGLYDTAGNVWEWCGDWYADDYYLHATRENPTGPERSKERVIRGGSWMCAENFCTNYRVAARSHATPDSGLNNLGFRCVRDLKPAPR